MLCLNCASFPEGKIVTNSAVYHTFDQTSEISITFRIFFVNEYPTKEFRELSRTIHETIHASYTKWLLFQQFSEDTNTLFSLKLRSTTEWLKTANFVAIRRYNKSISYANWIIPQHAATYCGLIRFIYFKINWNSKKKGLTVRINAKTSTHVLYFIFIFPYSHKIFI